MGLGEKRIQDQARNEAQSGMRQIPETPCLFVRREFRLLSPRPFVPILLTAMLLVACATANAISKIGDYEGRLISSIEIVFEGSPADPAAEAEFLSIIKIAPNSEYSAVGVRDSLQALFESERVGNARVEVLEGADKSGPI